MTQVAIVGTGFVGAASANALAIRNICSELLLIDLNHERAMAEAADIAHAAALVGTTKVYAGSYDDLKNTKVIVVTAGVNQKPGESRLSLLSRNEKIFNSIIPQIVEKAPNAVLVIATNPVDIMTEITRKLHPNPNQILGTGTLLDSARFRQLIARSSGVAARYIHANVLGEHGDSSVLCWESASVAGLNIDKFMESLGLEWGQKHKDEIERRVRDAAATIIAGKGATYYGIGASVSKIVDAILSNRHSIYTLSAPSEYGVCLSLPRVLGERGIEHTLYPKLSDNEQTKLEHSAAILRDTMQAIQGDTE